MSVDKKFTVLDCVAGMHTSGSKFYEILLIADEAGNRFLLRRYGKAAAASRGGGSMIQSSVAAESDPTAECRKLYAAKGRPGEYQLQRASLMSSSALKSKISAGGSGHVVSYLEIAQHFGGSSQIEAIKHVLTHSSTVAAFDGSVPAAPKTPRVSTAKAVTVSATAEINESWGAW